MFLDLSVKKTGLWDRSSYGKGHPGTETLYEQDSTGVKIKLDLTLVPNNIICNLYIVWYEFVQGYKKDLSLNTTGGRSVEDVVW
tara:strand:+ start:135 stop:386 length:252 start_codon:yes stop_codon:yes gene_type:complete